MARAGLVSWILIAWLLSSAVRARAGTELDFWHSYVHQPSGVVHFAFHIASYKRGLFFGSCGPSTRSMQWEYDVDLAGAGPVYARDQITLKRDGQPVAVAAGTIKLDAERQHATLDLQTAQPATNQPAVPVSFPGNGTHRIRKTR